jgi:hypothetical protein
MRPQEPVVGPGWILKLVALWLPLTYLLTNRISHTPFGTNASGLDCRSCRGVDLIRLSMAWKQRQRTCSNT